MLSGVDEEGVGVGGRGGGTDRSLDGPLSPALSCSPGLPAIAARF